MRIPAILATVILLLLPAALGAADTFPFPIQTLNTNPDATDMSYLNEKPAGKSGFVAAKGGHFVDGSGKRIRFLGVNLCAGAAFPEHVDADKVAARLAKLGVNCVRLHHMDNGYAPRGIWDPAYKDKQHIDKSQLDKLDYLIAALKRNGIYIDLNLHVSRQFSEADGFPDADKLTNYDKGVDNFEPRMIELQKNYARDLLTHTNAYTGKRYADEPAIAIIEINNENSLVNYCMDGAILTIPDYYLSELRKQWNAWLRAKYGATAKLRKVWEAGSVPLGPNMLANSDLSEGARHWVLEAPSPAQADMRVEDGGPNGSKCLHATLTREGLRSWDFQVHQVGLDLADGKPYVLSFWARANRPRKVYVNVRLDQDPWSSSGLDATVELPVEWKRYEISFVANDTVKNHNRVSFNLQSEIGEVWISDVQLHPGTGGRIPDTASLEAGNIAIPQESYTIPQRTDFLAFAAEKERDYATGMRRYIKSLGSKSLVVDTQVTYSGIAGLYRESLLDFGDTHAYWQHPSFPHKPWDSQDWKITNTPMVRALGRDTLTHMALGRLEGKPFTVSEYNHPAPSDYAAECVPMLAAFAAQQDWDGIFLFDYHASNGDWDRDRISSYFSIDSNPSKIAFMPTAAAIFRRADVAPAAASAVMTFPIKQIPDELCTHGANIARAWQSLGLSPRDTMDTRTSVRFSDNADRSAIARNAGYRPVTSAPSVPFVPHVTWECDKGKEAEAAFIINSPASRGIIGFASGRATKLGGLSIEATGDADHFAAIAAIALDGKPLERSKHLLISAVGRVENTGMVWNEDRTSVGNKWGSAPAIAEGIAARITLATTTTSAQVYALDGGGGRATPVSCTTGDNKITIDLKPDWKTLWYEVILQR